MRWLWRHALGAIWAAIGAAQWVLWVWEYTHQQQPGQTVVLDCETGTNPYEVDDWWFE